MQTRALAYSQFWRVVIGVLTVISRGSLLGLAVALLFFETPLDNPLRLLRTFVLVSLAPGIAAWPLTRVFAALASVEAGTLVVQRRHQRIEIPCASIVGVEPWSIPVPGGGLWLRLRSGRRFHEGLQVADPIALADALAAAGAADGVRADVRSPSAVYAASRGDYAASWGDYAASRADGRRRWYHVLLKFPVLALIPTLPVFRLHQWVAYGGTFGEYYTYGLQAYALGFAAFWWTLTIYLVLYAAVLRTVAEVVVAVTAWAWPARVLAVRRVVDAACLVAYLAGVPLYLVRLASLAS